MNNPYPYMKVERFALRETITRPFSTWKSLVPIVIILAILCPPAALVATFAPLVFLRDNLEYKRIPAITIAVGVVFTVASIATGVVPIGDTFAHMGPYLHGSPNWLMFAAVWLVGSAWYSAPVLIVGGLIAWGRGAAIDLSKEKFLQGPREGLRSLEKRKAAAYEELAAADITDAIK